jgi:hypothetical protein
MRAITTENRTKLSALSVSPNCASLIFPTNDPYRFDELICQITEHPTLYTCSNFPNHKSGIHTLLFIQKIFSKDEAQKIVGENYIGYNAKGEKYLGLSIGFHINVHGLSSKKYNDHAKRKDSYISSHFLEEIPASKTNYLWEAIVGGRTPLSAYSNGNKFIFPTDNKKALYEIIRTTIENPTNEKIFESRSLKGKFFTTLDIMKEFSTKEIQKILGKDYDYIGYNPYNNSTWNALRLVTKIDVQGIKNLNEIFDKAF